MRLSERVFAFWRLPAWTDVVQVLLWLLGWLLVWGFSALAAVVLASTLGAIPSWPGGEAAFGVILLISAASTAIWFLGGCWFVSEAYRGWRAGHRHGRQWVLVIGALLLLGGAGMALGGFDLDPLQVALAAGQVSLGVALLVSGLTTRPPAAAPAAEA